MSVEFRFERTRKGYAVSGVDGVCGGEDVAVPGEHDGERVERIGDGAFAGLPLRSVFVPVSVAEIGDGAFSSCASMTEVSGMDGVRTIGGRAFEGCASLASFAMPGSVKKVGRDAFLGCASLEKVFAEDLVAWLGISFANADSNPLHGRGETTLVLRGEPVETLAIPDGTEKIRRFAFAGIAMDGVSLPESLRAVGYRAFDGCEGFVLHLPDILTLCLLDFPGSPRDRSPLDEYGGLLAGEEPVGDLALPMLADLEADGDGFYFYDDGDYGVFLIGYRGDRTDLTLPVPEGRTYAVYDYAFFCRKSLRSLTVPDGVTTVGYHAFEGCTALESVSFGKDVSEINDCAFRGCASLRTLRFGKGLSLIGEEAFAGCDSLKTVCLPDGLDFIDDEAFACCRALEGVVIPKSIIRIGGGAFEPCEGDEDRGDPTVYFRGDRKTLEVVGEFVDWLTEDATFLEESEVFFYKEEKPKRRGKYGYWHFDGEGNPVAW